MVAAKMGLDHETATERGNVELTINKSYILAAEDILAQT